MEGPGFEGALPKFEKARELNPEDVPEYEATLSGLAALAESGGGSGHDLLQAAANSPNKSKARAAQNILDRRSGNVRYDVGPGLDLRGISRRFRKTYYNLFGPQPDATPSATPSASPSVSPELQGQSGGVSPTLLSLGSGGSPVERFIVSNRHSGIDDRLRRNDAEAGRRKKESMDKALAAAAAAEQAAAAAEAAAAEKAAAKAATAEARRKQLLDDIQKAKEIERIARMKQLEKLEKQRIQNLAAAGKYEEPISIAQNKKEDKRLFSHQKMTLAEAQAEVRNVLSRKYPAPPPYPKPETMGQIRGESAARYISGVKNLASLSPYLRYSQISF